MSGPMQPTNILRWKCHWKYDEMGMRCKHVILQQWFEDDGEGEWLNVPEMIEVET